MINGEHKPKIRTVKDGMSFTIVCEYVVYIPESELSNERKRAATATQLALSAHPGVGDGSVIISKKIVDKVNETREEKS